MTLLFCCWHLCCITQSLWLSPCHFMEILDAPLAVTSGCALLHTFTASRVSCLLCLACSRARYYYSAPLCEILFPRLCVPLAMCYITILWLWVFVALMLYSVQCLPLPRHTHCWFTVFCCWHTATYVHNSLDLTVAYLMHSVYHCLGVLVACVWQVCARGTIICCTTMLCPYIFIVYKLYFMLSTCW